jgi:hypothetical protein
MGSLLSAHDVARILNVTLRTAERLLKRAPCPRFGSMARDKSLDFVAKVRQSQSRLLIYYSSVLRRNLIEQCDKLLARRRCFYLSLEDDLLGIELFAIEVLVGVVIGA